MPDFLTLTVNPAIDLGCTVPVLEPTHKLRVPGHVFDPGGGGVNVARVLHALGAAVEALVLLGGDEGVMFGHLLDRDAVPWRVVPIAGATRISINLREAQTGREYRIVPAGPPIAPAEWQAALAALRIATPRWVVASGSLAPGLPVEAYREVAAVAREIGARSALDTSGAALTAVRGAGFDVLKLSLRELRHLSGLAAESRAAQNDAALSLVADGTARCIAVTLGAEGALLADQSGIVRRDAFPVRVQSTVGAGDSFLAGLVQALAEGAEPGAALHWASAVSAAAVAAEGTARVTREAAAILAAANP